MEGMVCRLRTGREFLAYLSWACEVPFRTVHAAPRFLSLSNKTGEILTFAQWTTLMAVSHRRPWKPTNKIQGSRMP